MPNDDDGAHDHDRGCVHGCELNRNQMVRTRMNYLRIETQVQNHDDDDGDDVRDHDDGLRGSRGSKNLC